MSNLEKIMEYPVNDFESYKKDWPEYIRPIIQEAKEAEWFRLYTMEKNLNERIKLNDTNKTPKLIQKLSVQKMVIQEQNAKTADKPRNEIPLCEKYALTIDEAAIYFGIGTKKLREMVRRYPNKGVFIKHGNKVLIKRVMFEKFLNGLDNI